MDSQLINFVIPNKLLKEVDTFAKSQYKSRSAILREAARRVVEEAKERKEDFAAIRKIAAKVNLSEDQAISLIDKIRSQLPMNKQSLFHRNK